MSMTREEIIHEYEAAVTAHAAAAAAGIKGAEKSYELFKAGLSALRPVSREQVEKVWRGEWNQDEHGRVVCNRCGSMAAIGTENALHNAKKYDRFCFYCGAPMTDEAVQMVMERLEAPYASDT